MSRPGNNSEVSRWNMGNLGIQEKQDVSDSKSVAKAGSNAHYTNEQKEAYGLDAELAAKAKAKYDPQLERQAQEWIEQILHESFPGGFAESLKNGQRLCKVLNAIRPGTVKNINTSQMPFKQMENISNFLAGCRSLGMRETDLFSTVDLFEEKDLLAVVMCIHALGGVAKKIGFQGPTIGVAYADPNQRDHNRFQPATGAVPMLNMGNYGIQERLPTTGHNIVKTTETGSTEVSKLSMGNYGIQEKTNIDHSRDIDKNSHVNWGRK